MTVQVKLGFRKRTLRCQTCKTADLQMPTVTQEAGTNDVQVVFLCNNGGHQSCYVFSNIGKFNVRTV